MISAQEAMQRLKDGNHGFVSGLRGDDQRFSRSRMAELADRQEPLAVVLGCSDSRVPVEIVFGQGLGDLFVVRIAGNISTPSVLGSIEFAVSQFGTRLVVVLGHSQCGAVSAAVDELDQIDGDVSDNLGSIVKLLRPSVERARGVVGTEDYDTLVSAAVRENIEATVKNIENDSALLRQLVENDGLLIAGAQYSLDTGIVNFETSV